MKSVCKDMNARQNLFCSNSEGLVRGMEYSSLSIKTKWMKESLINPSHWFSAQWNNKTFFVLGPKSRFLVEMPFCSYAKQNLISLCSSTPTFLEHLSLVFCLPRGTVRTHPHFTSHCSLRRIKNINTGISTTQLPFHYSATAGAVHTAIYIPQKELYSSSSNSAIIQKKENF